MKRGKLFILSGPSGSGKTTLYKRLLRRPALSKRLVKVVSCTTRPRRKNEKDGRDYFFLSPKEFRREKNAGGFLESQNVFGFFYGTPRRAAEALLSAGRHVLLCIDVKGARAVKSKRPAAVSIFVLPPSLKALSQRLKGRSTEGKTEMLRRLKVASREIAASRRYNYRIINDNLNQALRQLEAIVICELRGKKWHTNR